MHQDRFTALLKSPEFVRVGGLFFIQPVWSVNGIHYTTLYVENESALPACRIPGRVSEGLGRSNVGARRSR